MKFTTRIIDYGKLTRTGRSYSPTETLIPERQIYGTIEPPDGLSIPVQDVCAFARVFERPDGVWAEIATLEQHHHGRTFSELMDAGYSVAPMGAGNIAEDGLVRNYHLVSFYLTKEPSFI